MGHIKIEPHADCIGGDKEIYIAILIHSDLRIAGSGAEGAHNHRRAALGAAQELGDRIYIFNRKTDYCRSSWHSAYLFRT